MLELPITKTEIAQAERLADDLGQLKNSIMKGTGNLTGFLGEILVANLFEVPLANTYDYDIYTEWGTIDVKTKLTTAVPQGYYDQSVAAFNTKQKCEWYAFCRVHKDLQKGWFLGVVPKDFYFANARFLQKGQIDPDNNFTVRADCYNMSINEIWGESQKHIEII